MSPGDTTCDPSRQRERRLENSVIRRIFDTAEARPRFEELRVLAYEEFGDPLVTFPLFHRQYPGFPLRLESLRIPHIHKLGFWELLADSRTLLRSRLFQRYRAMQIGLGVDPRETSFGLVFPITYRSKFVLHDLRDEEIPRPRRERPRHVVPLPKANPPQCLTVEPLKGLLHAIGDGWLRRRG